MLDQQKVERFKGGRNISWPVLKLSKKWIMENVRTAKCASGLRNYKNIFLRTADRYFLTNLTKEGKQKAAKQRLNSNFRILVDGHWMKCWAYYTIKKDSC